MKIAISGASGFVGTHLTEVFTAKGYEVVPLNKDIFDQAAEHRLIAELEGCDVVINLAGAPINHRWTKRYKQMMYNSRIGVTSKLVSAINSLEVKPRLLISTSAVGYYPSLGCYDEYNSEPGSGFLSKLCVEWERESQKVSSEVRLINTRFAVILDVGGGAFPQMIKSTKFGIATVIGSGRQPFPWISLEDHGRAIEFIIDHLEINGTVDLVAPQQINNHDFTKAVARRFGSLLTFRIPTLFFKLLMGESAEFITEGQCVKPAKLIEAGFTFNSDTIEKFLKTIKNES